MNTSWGNLTQRWGVDLKMALNGKHHKQQGPFICGIRTKQFFFSGYQRFRVDGETHRAFLNRCSVDDGENDMDGTHQG